MTGLLRGAIPALCLATAIGCAGPAAPDIPDLTDGTLHFFGVLIADSSHQYIHVNQTDARPIIRVEAVLNEVAPDGTLSHVATARPQEGQSVGFVMEFEAAVRPGRRYQVTVSAPGRPSASAETTVPADFSIADLDARGAPPGSDGLDARWTPSQGAFRYILTVRATPDCVTRAPMCETFGEPWTEVTAETRITTVVPAVTLPPERTLGIETSVYAVNRDLFDYLTTGVGGPFTVVPKQNVRGGHGALGAWVRRTRTTGPELVAGESPDR